MATPHKKRKDVFVIGDNILSPVGKTTAENLCQLNNNVSGVKRHLNAGMLAVPFSASLFPEEEEILAREHSYTKFEQLLIASVADAISSCPDIVLSSRTILIISSTKGNIDLLESAPYHPSLHNRIALHTSADLVAKHFGFMRTPIVVSNACISGVLAIINGMRLLRSGTYDNAVVVGADVISKFVLSGFDAFQALSPDTCRPFDQDRKGINLGEGAATIVLSVDSVSHDHVQVLSGAVSNDANHISGPSRTGAELAWAIDKAMANASLAAEDISFISAHGTATSYNDEMEANAMNLVSLEHTPLNSLKGYYGHTLGAAGIIESVVSINGLTRDIVFPTPHFENMGVSKPVNVTKKLLHKPLKYCLKTASGFGGCNAALIFGK